MATLSSSCGVVRRFVPGGLCSANMPCSRLCTRVFEVSFNRVVGNDPSGFVALLRQHLEAQSLLPAGTLFSIWAWMVLDRVEFGLSHYRCLVVFSRPLPFSSTTALAYTQVRGLFSLDCVGFSLVDSLSCSHVLGPTPVAADLASLFKLLRRKHCEQAEGLGAFCVEDLDPMMESILTL